MGIVLHRNLPHGLLTVLRIVLRLLTFTCSIPRTNCSAFCETRSSVDIRVKALFYVSVLQVARPSLLPEMADKSLRHSTTSPFLIDPPSSKDKEETASNTLRISIKELAAHRSTIIQVSNGTGEAVEWSAVGNANDTVSGKRRVRRRERYRRENIGDLTSNVRSTADDNLT